MSSSHPPQHAPAPSMSSDHSRTPSHSSPFSPLPTQSSNHGHAHSASASVSSSRALTPSFGHAQSASMTYTPQSGHNHSPSLGHAIPLTPIKELTSAQSSPARPRAASAAQREAAESGAPISGMYAKSGFWDDDSDENDKERSISWRSRLSGSTSSNTGDRRSLKSTKSSKSGGGGRSRSNTLAGIVSPSPPVEASPWPWARRSQQGVPVAPLAHCRASSLSQSHGRGPSTSQTHASGPSIADSTGVTSRPPSVQALPTASSSPVFPSPPSTYGSSATNSSAALPLHPLLPEVPHLKPRKSKTRLRLRSKSVRQNEMDSQDLKTPVARPPLSPVTNSSTPTAKRAPTPIEIKTVVDGKKQSAWKRGMERLRRSRSAGNMRDQYNQGEQENLPPVPSLPLGFAVENARSRLTSQASATPSSVLSSAAFSATTLSPPSALQPDLSGPSPPLSLLPDPSASYLPSPNLSGSAALSRAHSYRSSNDDPILAELDQRYPSYCALQARPSLIHADAMDSDPFASAIDYSHLPDQRATSRSPLPHEFARLPSPPPIDGHGSPWNSPSLTNLKQSLVPRLRKSKSMGLTRQPSSVLNHLRSGIEAGRMSRAASPVPSPNVGPSTPERVPALDELVAIAMRDSPLAPPRPQFYDSFDLGDDSDSKDEPDRVVVQPVENVETMARSAPISRRGSLRSRTTSTSQAPDLSIDVTAAASVSGSSIELVTPHVSHTRGSGRFSPSQSSSEALEHQHRPSPGQDDTAGIQETWQRGHSRTQSDEIFARALAEKAHRQNEIASRENRSETCPSTFGTQSWEAAIAAFPTIDDHVNINGFHNNHDSPRPAERESLASNTAVAPTDSSSHSLADYTPPSRSYDHSHAESSGDTPPPDPNSAMWSSWRDVPRRHASGRSESSRASSHGRRARTVEGAWDDSDSDTSESEDEDVPLGSLHPGAAAAQQQRLADQKQRREARRARRAMRDAKNEVELRRSATSATTKSRRQWNGEGVPPDALAGQLERVVVGNAPPVPSRALRPPPSEHNDRSDPGTPSLSRAATVGRSMSGHSARSGASGHRIPSDGDRSASLSRATSISSPGPRKRSHSSAGRMPMLPTPTEPTPVRRPTPVRCVVVHGTDVRPINLDAFPETTARDVLMGARTRGDIADGNWVVIESFAELGLERQVREHELILSGVTKGWDPTAPNAIVLREMPPHNVWTRNIPDTPPMVCGWVQLETKPGKWVKKWLDVRGGQVFLSKNEKGKDEVHISTLFSDVYTVRKNRGAPMPSTFALKRQDAAASFQNPAEYISYLAADDATGWKLHSAIFSSRSFALAQADPSVRARLHPSAHSHSFTATPLPMPIGPSLAKHTGLSRTPTAHSSRPRPRPTAGHGPTGGQPLVDLKAEQTGFTGQGLLHRNHQL